MFVSARKKANKNKPVIADSPEKLKNPVYGLDPVIDKSVKYLILGTFPANESIDAGFYYNNQSRRFWGQALGAVDKFIGRGIDEKRELLLKHNIGLWDIFKCVERSGSNQDSAIQEAVYNDLGIFLKKYANIKYLVFNGKTAEKWLREDQPEIFSMPQREIKVMQSTSGSNGHFNGGEDWDDLFNG